MKVKKTIQMETVPLLPEQTERIRLVMRCHQEIYNFLAPWVCSQDNLDDCTDFRKMRDKIRKHKHLKEEMIRHLDNLGLNIFGKGNFPSAIWTMALSSLCANRKTFLEQMYDWIRRSIVENRNLPNGREITSDERDVLMYCLHVPALRRQIIGKHPVSLDLILDPPKKQNPSAEKKKKTKKKKASSAKKKAAPKKTEKESAAGGKKTESKKKAESGKKKEKTIKEKLEGIDLKRLNFLFSWVRRIWKQRETILKTNKPTWMRLDKCGYKLIQSEEGWKKSTRLTLSGVKKNEPVLSVDLKGVFYTSKQGKTAGSITVVFDPKKNVLKIQRAVDIHVQKRKSGKRIGADVGINTLICASNEKSFDLHPAKKGKGRLPQADSKTTKKKLKAAEEKARTAAQGKPVPVPEAKPGNYKLLLQQQTAWRVRRLSQVQKTEARIEGVEETIQGLKAMAEGMEDGDSKKRILDTYYRCIRRKHRMMENNRSDRLNRSLEKHAKRLEDEINRTVRDFLESVEDESILCMEDLDIRGKSCWRNEVQAWLSSWMYGVLQERMDYKASLKGMESIYVNPAYTSQYCHVCKEKITRNEKNKQEGQCPGCGKINADLNAAHNIVWAGRQKKIQKYTPHSEIRKLYEARKEEMNGQASAPNKASAARQTEAKP